VVADLGPCVIMKEPEEAQTVLQAEAGASVASLAYSQTGNFREDCHQHSQLAEPTFWNQQ